MSEQLLMQNNIEMSMRKCTKQQKRPSLDRAKTNLIITTTANRSTNHKKFRFFYSRYETSSDLLNDLDCQKKAICEVYQNALELGEISTRARHSLDFLDSASVLSVPDEFLNIIDEFTVSFLFREISYLVRFENRSKIPF